jgi:hypothetical protein
MSDPAGSIRLKLFGVHPTDASRNTFLVTRQDKGYKKIVLGETRLPQQMVQELKQMISGRAKE